MMLVRYQLFPPQASSGVYCRLNGGQSAPQNPFFFKKYSGVILTDWKAKAERMKFDEGLSWTEISAQLNPYFPGLTDTQIHEKVRAYIRTTPRYKANKQPMKKEPNEVTDEQILSALKTKRTPQQDAEILHMPITEFVRSCDRLTSDGYNVREASGFIWLETAPMADNSEVREQYNGETEITFGLISDTHLCNKKQQLTYLNQFYDLCQAAGIKTVYHCGDVSDGYYKNRPEHIYELVKLGFDEQAEYIIENYPKRDGITTKFITGNHDSTHVKNGGSDIGKRISDKRPDMEYLGYMSAKVWLTPQCDIDLFHPLDGVTYALSYSSQKFVDGLQGGQKPRILAIGHHHKALFYPYRNIHVFEVPCFEAQTDFEKGKKISVNVGGWIVKLTCKPDGTVTSISPTLIPYYDMVSEDY